jgi:hypothetical protein
MWRPSGGSGYRAAAARRTAFAGGRRRIRGDRAFRKLLRKMPDAIREEIFRMMEVAGDQILAAQRADAPRRTGRLAAALSKRVSKASLRLRVGVIGRPLNRRLFYGHILEVGRRAQVVTARRTTRSGTISTYQMRVRAIMARPFTRSVRTIARAAQGIDDA